MKGTNWGPGGQAPDSYKHFLGPAKCLLLYVSNVGRRPILEIIQATHLSCDEGTPGEPAGATPHLAGGQRGQGPQGGLVTAVF